MRFPGLSLFLCLSSFIYYFFSFFCYIAVTAIFFCNFFCLFASFLPFFFLVSFYRVSLSTYWSIRNNIKKLFLQPSWHIYEQRKLLFWLLLTVSEWLQYRSLVHVFVCIRLFNMIFDMIHIFFCFCVYIWHMEVPWWVLITEHTHVSLSHMWCR